MSQDNLVPLPDYSPHAIEQAFDELSLELAADASVALSIDEIEQFRLRWAGRKQGKLQAISQSWLKNAPDFDSRKLVGAKFAILKEQVEKERIRALARAVLPGSQADKDKLLPTFLLELDRLKIRQNLDREAIDVTLPGTRTLLGAEHPIVRTMNEIVSVFQGMGYSVGVGPEVETDYYNFESLNFPPNHPARDTQDTLVVANQERRPLRDRLLMRTHTSPVQIRTMEQQPPPVRIVIPGKVHRNDATDATHSPIFHQVEGLCVGENVTFSDLKGTLDHAMKAFFGPTVKTRFFPSFFPFTEPSADVQISCIFCGGKGCRKCKHSGWIELLGCGMVDPAVFGFVQQKQPGYDPEKISGFAFGMGVERIAMMKYGASDIGQFYSGDMRFLKQFV
jgi:phenylalanyl-tRNA synthetase alpha chain